MIAKASRPPRIYLLVVTIWLTLTAVVTSVIMELGVYPVIYYIWKGWKLKDA